MNLELIQFVTKHQNFVSFRTFHNIKQTRQIKFNSKFSELLNEVRELWIMFNDFLTPIIQISSDVDYDEGTLDRLRDIRIQIENWFIKKLISICKNYYGDENVYSTFDENDVFLTIERVFVKFTKNSIVVFDIDFGDEIDYDPVLKVHVCVFSYNIEKLSNVVNIVFELLKLPFEAHIIEYICPIENNDVNLSKCVLNEVE